MPVGSQPSAADVAAVAIGGDLAAAGEEPSASAALLATAKGKDEKVTSETPGVNTGEFSNVP